VIDEGVIKVLACKEQLLSVDPISDLKEIISYYTSFGRSPTSVSETKSASDSSRSSSRSNSQEEKANPRLEPEALKIKPTVSYHIRTGHYYRGAHSDALNFSFSPSEDIKLKRLMISLVERIALIDDSVLSELQNSLANPEAIITKLHEIYKALADKAYRDMKAEVDRTVVKLCQAYKNSDNSCEESLKNYIKLLLTEDLTAEKKALKESCENLSEQEAKKYRDSFKQKCEEIEQQKKQLRTELSVQGVKVGKLTHDTTYCATVLLSPHKATLEKKLRDLKKPINQLGQQLNFQSVRLTHRKPSDTLDYDAYFVPSYEAAQSDQKHQSVSPEKKEERTRKTKFSWIAFIVALLVGLGEAIIPSLAMSAVCANPVILALVFFSGFYANYNLVKKDTYDTINQLWSGKLFLDEQGEPVSLEREIAMIGFGFFSIFSGACYGALSATSCAQSMLAVLSGVLPAAAVGVLVTPIMIATAIGLGAMFFVAIASLIKEDPQSGIKKYCREKVIGPLLAWKDMSRRERALCLVGLSFRVIKVIVGLCLAVAITIASFGLFSKDISKIAAYFANVDLAEKIGNVIAFANMFVMFPFGARKNQQTMDGVSPSGLLTGIINLIVGAILLSFAIIEIIWRVITCEKEWAAVSCGRFLDAICKKSENFIEYLDGCLPSWARYRPTFCNFETIEVGAAAAVEVDAVNSSNVSIGKLLPSLLLLKKVNEDRICFQEKLLPNAIDWNTAGQALLFAAAAVTFAATAVAGSAGAGAVIWAVVMIAEIMYSRNPNFLALRGALADADACLPSPLRMR